VSPLFGHKETDEEPAGASSLQTDVERLDTLSLSDLAAEVMHKGFGPGGPGEDPDEKVSVGGANIASGVEIGEIAATFNDDRRSDENLRQRLQRLVAEGVQVLEHAGLVRTQMHTSQGGLDYVLTRRGRAALRDGTVERILGDAGDE
jgi:hypothetical protein